MRKFLKIVLFFLLLPYGLAILYLAVPPPSTLMIAGLLTGQKVERDWVPMSRISRNLKAAVITSEDSAFCSHWGFDFKQIGKSISKAHRNDDPVRATSTITQQLAKNLFLWHGRSWIRKLLEIPLTFWIELTWSKARILEVYLNIAEWGEGVYGAEAAARHHFGTSAANLSIAQSVRLATSLPNPIERNAASPGPAQSVMAAMLAKRVYSAGADLSCIR